MVADSSPDKLPTLIVIAGPTGVGKTNIAIDVAKYLNTEIVSADSRQLYKGLEIGTAAPTIEQLNTVKHHLVGNLSPDDYFNISMYESAVLNLLEDLFTRLDTVILTGGSGLYIKAVLDGIDDLPDIDPAVRSHLNDLYANEGITSLRRLLLKYDPEYAQRVDLANPNRIIRAVEVSVQTGKPYSSLLNKSKRLRNFRAVKIALNLPRAELHNRINMRVNMMVNAGLIEEARAFYHLRHLNSLNTVGYKELFEHFDGLTTLDEALEKIKTNSRRYARRQITWFNREKDYKWLPPAKDVVIEYINETLALT